MDARLQRRVQRYGWDLAAEHYDALWQAQLDPAQAKLLECAAPAQGEKVIDVACGTGRVSFAAALAVGPSGHVLGVDLSERMVLAAGARKAANVRFERMDAEHLDLPDGAFDVATCALGLMYMPDPSRALREMHRVLRPGGRLAVAVWGARARCGWSPVFPIVDAEVRSEVCPLFFGLGQGDALACACLEAGFGAIRQHRIGAVLAYRSGEEACDAAFVGGPVALAWSRFDGPTRARVRERYLDAIAPWRSASGYRVPAEFVVVEAGRPL